MVLKSDLLTHLIQSADEMIEKLYHYDLKTYFCFCISFMFVLRRIQFFKKNVVEWGKSKMRSYEKIMKY